MATTPKYDNDYVTLGYLNKTLNNESEQTKTEINKIPKNYNSPPVPPYYENSLLLLNGQIYKCIKSRLVGSFNISDWKIVVSTNELDEALRFIYDVNKLEYVDQEDGVIETFYQEEDPSLNWETDIEKNKHVSDLWTIDNSICYQYEKKATNPVTYGWKRVSIPTSLFDIVDGYRKIFTEEPTNYSKDDLWLGEITKIAIESSETFDSSHWEDRDDFIESSTIEQEEYHKVYLLPKITEINRQTQSEIKKAVDEIVLRVSQTYTTKTEVEQYIDDVKTGVAEEYTTKEEFNSQLSLTSTQINAIVEKNTQQDGNIETLNQEYANLKITSDGIKTQVSSIETEIETTNENVNSLQTEIQGVNANFNEFKDNEYINSINNLQDQIDGAIQFWNGPEIPTIENYPANEWITENEKINHQADIYTVIQDVEGEMKQGKSYRFDKINGVWKWIELTDNELSAVQAIAQDALNKSNQNTTDIQSLNKKTSELEQTDSEIRASVTILNNKYEKDITIKKETSGNPITIEDAGAYPCESFIVEGKSEQKVTTQKAGDNIFDFKVWHNKISSGDITISYDKNGGFILNENGFSTRNVPTGTDSWINVDAKVDGVMTRWGYTSTGLSDATKQVAKQFTLPAKASTEYTLSCDVSFDTALTGTATKTELFAFLYDENFDYLGLKTLQIKNEFEANVPQRLSLTFSTNATTKYIFWRVDNESYNTTPANMTVANISIKEGKDTTYTEYVPNSPSPDYPSEIETVKGITNLCGLEEDTMTHLGLTITYKGNEFTINGTTTGAGNVFYNPNESVSTNFRKVGHFKAGAYSITLKLISGDFTIPSGAFAIYLKTEDNVTLRYCQSDFNIKRTFTIDEDTNLYFQMYANSSGIVFNNCVIQIQIEEGLVAHNIVPYGSRYLINKITGKNKLYTPYTENNKLTVTATRNDFYKITDYYAKLEAGKTYTFSCKSDGVWKYSENEDTVEVYIMKDKTSPIYATSTSGVKTFTPTVSGDYYIRVDVNQNGKTHSFWDFQIEEDSIATNSEPYKENIIIYDLKKENLFDKNVITLNSFTNTTTGVIGSSDTQFVSDYIDIENMKTLSCNAKSNTSLQLYGNLYDENKTFLQPITVATGTIINIPDINAKYVRFTFRNLYLDTLDDLVIYEGIGTEDNYELCKIGDIADELDEASGVLTKRIGKVVLNGNETWSLSTSSNFNRFDTTINNIKKYGDTARHNDLLSSHFIASINNGYGVTMHASNKIYLYPQSDITTVSELKTWLSNNPVTVYYVLAEEETIQLEPTEIELFKGTNNIYTLDDLEPNMNITYLTDSKMNTQYATKSELKIAEGRIESGINATLQEYSKTTEMKNIISQEVSESTNQILLEVENKIDEEVTGASILLKINEDTSSATINADKINLNGVVTANNTFKINTDGSMEATGGKIGGWSITENDLYNSNSGISSNLGKYAFWAGETNNANGTVDTDAKFRVGHDGSIHATAGIIGGWTIGADRIYSQPSEGNTILFANGANEYKDVLVIYKDDTVPFYLHSDGYLYATNGYIAGNMVSSGINAGNITAGTLNIHNGSTYYLKMGFGTSHPEVSGLNVTGSGGINMNNHSIGACYDIGTQYISASGSDGIVKCNTIFRAENLWYKDDSGTYRDVVGLYRWFLNGKSDYIDVRDADGSTKLRLHFSNGLYTGYTRL